MDTLNVYANILKSRFLTQTPLALTHLVTSLCNCKCKTCDLWKKSSEYKNDLSKEEIFKMLKDAKRAGIINYTAWGGEPLLRKDLPEILQFAKEQKITTTVITNGFFLKERYNEILPFVDFLIVSIDSNDDLHDKMRGVRGLRERAIEGIKLCKKTKTRIIINSVISNLNLDKAKGLLELSKELDVSITFEPMEIIEGYNEQLRPTKEELKTVFSKIIKFKKAGYHVGNSLEYLENFSKQKKYVCHAPKFYITVDTRGNVLSCLKKNWGNIKNKDLREIFRSREFKRFCKDVENCNKCDVSCVIETSLAYSLNPLFFLDKSKNLLQ
jgi:MoaA/NifB/PqqE/SkfB family radical SAM enzyme